ncbi:MAG TPA: D-TA family PLP-dependent enzyme [Pricia sp.]|nr:D-TA family PLP-dependent enzyme [Pricia sp.]
MEDKNWYRINDPNEVISPALLVYPARILHNIKKMIEMAGGTEHLRPHIKTHKTAEIIQMQLDSGIRKFKCATIAEAELLALSGVPDILLAMQPVGANMARFFKLMHKYPESDFSALVDNIETLKALSSMAKSNGPGVTKRQPRDIKATGRPAKSQRAVVSLWMDINCGMNRTGILPGKNAIALYREMDADPNVKAMGLHAYDGHIRNTNVTRRKKDCDRAFEAVMNLKSELEAGLASAGVESAGVESPGEESAGVESRLEIAKPESKASIGGIPVGGIPVGGIPVRGIVAGGSPTFPFHAKRDGVVASPGTTLLWDAGYGALFPDMEFLPAAVLLTRIISKPAKDTICLDLGHKHIAPEMPFPRVQFLNLENGVQKGQSEEHLVLECKNAEDYAVGDILYALPVHICPTVAKYERLQVVSEGKIIDSWEVAARKSRITV